MHVDPTDHLPLVRYWANKFCLRRDDMDDLVQMGTLGLLRAAARFDPGRGVAFSTFASLLIRQAIIGELKRTQPLIRVPEHWPVDRRIPVRSLNRHVGDDGTELGDLLPDDRAPVPGERADADHQRARVRAALARLPRRDRLVLELRYGLADGAPRTLAAISAVLGVSRERVRQLQLRAEARLARRLAG